MVRFLAIVFLTGLLAVGAHAQPLPYGGSSGGGGSGCVPTGGSSTNIVLYGTLGACSPANSANITGGALTLGASGTLGSLTMGNATSGMLTLEPVTGAITGTVLIPSGPDTLVNLTGTQTLSNKTLVAPALGTPASGVATNLTGTASSLTAGTATAANGLNSATTTVVVNGATAPSSGQVLTATSSTAADWATPSGGSGITFTDGSHTVTGSTQLTITGGTVGGSTPNATLTISAATTITPGTTTISGATAPCAIVNSASTTMACDPIGQSGANTIIQLGGTGFLAAGIIPFGTATNQVAEGGVIAAAGPTGSATIAPIITYNAAGQLTTVSSATITPAIGSITGLGTGVATAAANAVNTSGGLVTSAQTYTSSIPISWDSNATVANGTIPLLNPAWAGGGTITSVTYYTNGTGTPSFTANVKIGSTSVTSCSALSVSSATPATTNCTAANTFTSSSVLTLAITSVSGTPNQALVQVNFTHTAN